ncbi:hypothetical protein FSB84_20715 [Pseudobacter ginsenosidimutans]|nr:hypothetical protein [Pseudobacter ginsenosidimutans]QEC43982.1 hypothetical protein FSB84_20715 [Pseudobacter ginsenosidimutans]
MSATTPHNPQSQRWIYKYSFASNAWENTNIELNSYAGTDGITFQKGEDVYYGGGYGYTASDPNPKTFYKYNLRTGAHTRLADMPTTYIENARPNTFILKEKMYGVVGTRMIVYDPALNSWTHYNNLPEDDEGHGILYSFQVGNRVISFTQAGSAFEYL